MSEKKKPIQQKYKDREYFFKTALDSFFNEDLNELTANLKNINDDADVALLTDGGELINKYYWEFVNKHIRPILLDGVPDMEDGDFDEIALIDVYKILSATEFAIMAVKPLFILINDQRIDYSKDKKLVIEESLINAYFAFHCSLTLLANWQRKYSHIFHTKKIADEILEYVEKPRKNEAMSIKDEHIAFIAFANSNSNFPVFFNSTWWRLFCLCGYLIEDNGINFKDKYLNKDSNTE